MCVLIWVLRRIINFRSTCAYIHMHKEILHLNKHENLTCIFDCVQFIRRWWLHSDGISLQEPFLLLFRSRLDLTFITWPPSAEGARVRNVLFSFCKDSLQFCAIRSSSACRAVGRTISSLVTCSTPSGEVSTSSMPCSARPSNARFKHSWRCLRIWSILSPSTSAMIWKNMHKSIHQS